MTNIQTSILKITKALRENAGIPVEEWPSSLPFSPVDMGLVASSGKLFLPGTVDFLLEEVFILRHVITFIGHPILIPFVKRWI